MAVKTKSWVQPDEVARYFNVSCSTVWGWISDGRLRAARLPTGHVRILARDVMKFLLQSGKPIPVELGDLAHKHVLIVDREQVAAEAMAGALREASGCKVTVAATASDARGMLDGVQPDLVLLAVRHPWLSGAGNGVTDMLILADARDEIYAREMHQEMAFRVGDIMVASVDGKQLVARVAGALLG